MWNLKLLTHVTNVRFIFAEFPVEAAKALNTPGHKIIYLIVVLVYFWLRGKRKGGREGNLLDIDRPWKNNSNSITPTCDDESNILSSTLQE